MDWKHEKVTVSKMKENVPIVSPMIPSETGPRLAI
jgi:hypothetical protein